MEKSVTWIETCSGCY